MIRGIFYAIGFYFLLTISFAAAEVPVPKPKPEQQDMCMSRTDLWSHLHSPPLSLRPVAAGVSSVGAIITIHTSDQGDNRWVVTQTWPRGTSCIVQAGEAWISFQ